MAFLSTARRRLHLRSHFPAISAPQKQRKVYECNLCVLPDIFPEYCIFGVRFLPQHSHQNSSVHHSYLHTLTFPKEESMRADCSNYILQASRLVQKTGDCAEGWQELSHRLIQTRSASTWDHPWSRDELAERMSFVKERRLNKERLKEKFKRMAASHSQHSASFPEMPLPSQPLEGALRPSTHEDETVAPLLARSDLIITRNIEWANLLVGFEQENRYVIMDPRESLTVVGFIAETSNWLARQFLRSRRPFVASIMDATGDVLFTVRRPIWFINSTIYAEINGEVVGFAKRRWHLWRRIYDVYLGKRQFAVVENPGFWNWTFTLKDENGSALAEIDRHFRGFGFEMLTDAGQYALRFGDVASNYHPPTKGHTLTAGKTAASNFQGIKVNPDAEAEQFISQRPLKLSERIVTLALAISLDNDYFSRHGGRFFPFPFISEE